MNSIFIKNLKIIRKIHRTTAFYLYFFILGLTGLILGWKKNSNGLILPKSHQGTSIELKNWLPLDITKHCIQNPTRFN